ncbi:hypothetical protein CBR_g4809 [Chara braunii]|uniref:Uncharacterized protein n=1 Tax=Chara braunii TaxID=69332 RepID=A0A388KIU9_CHABU|nr:hypothetical protein CBR_g4809 [Chara braunii]|eukprot:GBG69981.1 hypothetical protein CBR_g4809 [Chara braunii]
MVSFSSFGDPFPDLFPEFDINNRLLQYDLSRHRACQTGLYLNQGGMDSKPTGGESRICWSNVDGCQEGEGEAASTLTETSGCSHRPGWVPVGVGSTGAGSTRTQGRGITWGGTANGGKCTRGPTRTYPAPSGPLSPSLSTTTPPGSIPVPFPLRARRAVSERTGEAGKEGEEERESFPQLLESLSITANSPPLLVRQVDSTSDDTDYDALDPGNEFVKKSIEPLHPSDPSWQRVGKRPCLVCKGTKLVVCDKCEGRGRLSKGGYQKKNPLFLERIVDSKWTALERTFGWCHFRVESKKQQAKGIWYLEMVATCDPASRFWVNAQNLRDRDRWAMGWLQKQEISRLRSSNGSRTSVEQIKSSLKSEPSRSTMEDASYGTICKACKGLAQKPCKACSSSPMKGKRKDAHGNTLGGSESHKSGLATTIIDV